MASKATFWSHFRYIINKTNKQRNSMKNNRLITALCGMFAVILLGGCQCNGVFRIIGFR